MKRFVNLCMLVLASIGAYAQIDTADRNWRHIVDSDFSTPAGLTGTTGLLLGTAQGTKRI